MLTSATPDSWRSERPGRATVTADEAMAASAVVSEWRTSANVGTALTTSQLAQLRAYVAGALADARDGSTIPGQRQRVQIVVDVHGDVWRQDTDVELVTRRQLWARWASDLADQGLRPLGWPSIVTTFLRFRDLSLDHQLSPAGRDPFVECEEPAADLVRRTLDGLAVRA